MNNLLFLGLLFNYHTLLEYFEERFRPINVPVFVCMIAILAIKFLMLKMIKNTTNLIQIRYIRVRLVPRGVKHCSLFLLLLFIRSRHFLLLYYFCCWCYVNTLNISLLCLKQEHIDCSYYILYIAVYVNTGTHFMAATCTC